MMYFNTIQPVHSDISKRAKRGQREVNLSLPPLCPLLAPSLHPLCTEQIQTEFRVVALEKRLLFHAVFIPPGKFN